MSQPTRHFVVHLVDVVREHLLPEQMERILEINSRQEVTKAVVEAAGESLVIGGQA